MLLWYLGVSTAFVWNVFRSPALDYRLVMVGSVLPLLEVVVGGPSVLHTLVFAVALMTVIMLATPRRRLLRRRLISLPIGLMTGLVLDGAWTDKTVFWWPFFGWAFPRGGLPELQRGVPWIIVGDLIGTAALAWCWVAFGWSDRERRDLFIRTGRLSRDLVG
jgi:LexA-binding, inner membrane-associated putative hydrolase